MQLHLRNLDLSEVIDKSIAISRRDHKQEINVKFEKPAEPIMVECDEELIIHVMLNLLDNAIKFSPPDSPVVIAVEDQPMRSRSW